MPSKMPAKKLPSKIAKRFKRVRLDEKAEDARWAAIEAAKAANKKKAEKKEGKDEAKDGSNKQSGVPEEAAAPAAVAPSATDNAAFREAILTLLLKRGPQKSC